METDYINIPIEEIIPQRKPVVMIDRIISYDEKNIVSCLTVRPDNIFSNSYVLCEPGIIENIAQTAAAKSGLDSRFKKIPVPLGFIGAVKNLKIHELPECGTDITTKVTTDFEIANASVIKAEVLLKDKIIAECEMKIFIFNE